ncbi:hypothetical protein WJX73_006235 [Symbiochloris irregularis]|uniref:DNA replication licensing factor MCM7 n=1 Tax=Symbiochloris irregularis TaxID=706552 RepID=A0AAW1NXY9_9CHLO
MPDYVRARALCAAFLQNHRISETGEQKYQTILAEVANRKRKTFEIDLDDVAQYQEMDPEIDQDGDSLLEGLQRNTKRYARVFAEAIDQELPQPTAESFMDDTYDVLLKERQRRAEQLQAERGEDQPEQAAEGMPDIPAELLRRYLVVVKPQSKSATLKLREIGARHVGQLVSVKGIVTHITDVKPMMTVATYLDDSSATEVYQEVVGREFTPLETVPQGGAAGERTGQAGSGPPTLHVQTRGSKFVRFQEAKIQELASEVPQGATPRSVSVHLRGEVTRSMKPGSAVQVAGIFLPEPYTGFKAMRAGLLTNTFLEAQVVTHLKSSYQEVSQDTVLQARILDIQNGGDVYSRLANSIAPEIFGHEDVKKALLLLMVGGVTRQLPDGMKLRGDCHMCLMGDPGVAKSQLIKHIAHISPRAVYTTGKGSSGVGLTAAVQRDPVTSEMVLEGGALVLADKGICCIDEFDKMDEGDRTAIHEVMEQQTVSIAKAGITTTLNTRTTVLAAANPAWGRYDPKRSPSENINLPAALLSRFDIMWLMRDLPDRDQDLALAKHVVNVHRNGRAPTRDQADNEVLTSELLRGYIAKAKTYNPVISQALTGYIAAVYAELRELERAQQVPHSYTTARTLLSILRLSQALARLRCESTVEQPDIDEALRLMRMSKQSLHDVVEGRPSGRDSISEIYEHIRKKQMAGAGSRSWQQLTEDFQTRFTHDELRTALREYEAAGVWTITGTDSEHPGIVWGQDDAQANA